MLNRKTLFLTFSISILLMSGASAATTNPTVILLYDLLPGSSFQEGCIPPCMCPVMMSDYVKGTFGLLAGGPGPRPLVESSRFNTYILTGIQWTVYDSSGKPVHQITGEGTYRYQSVGVGLVRQQLTLDLIIDGAPELLDSGLVVGCSQFPDITISVHPGTTCFGISMDIAAAPGS